jgi:asparagine synthase (glutamine-hydrolysing)
MMHEPHYKASTFHDETLGVHVGWVGHEGSFSDCMPLWNEARDVCLLFSGEDFRELSEAEFLRGKGHKCDVEDASYLVHLYEEMEDRFFEKLNGRFAGLLIDMRSHKIILFNDRYGLARIYFHESKATFYFASEAKALLGIIPELRRLDLMSLAETFSCGSPLQNRTLFSGVSLMPGGSAWVFREGCVLSKGIYFDHEFWEKQPPLTEEEYYGRLKETFQRILPSYYRSKQRLAVSLTGGADSRMIMAWAKFQLASVPCYTFGGMYRESNDVRIARQVAQICGQRHEVISVGRDFLSQFPDLAERTVYLTDGAMDVTGAADLFVNRRARAIAPVRLTGNYGGEILRSIVAFEPNPLLEDIFEPQFRQYIRNAAETYFSELTGRRQSFVAFKQVPWHHFSRLCLESSQLTVRSPYLDNALVALAYQVPEHLAVSNAMSLRMIHDGNSELGSMGTDRSLTYGAETMIDRFRHIFEEFTFRAEYAFDYGMPHWLAKLDNQVRSFHVERAFLGRHKFYHFRIWYRQELSRYVKDMLLDSRTLSRPYYDARTLQKIVKGHTEGNRNHTLEIHRVLTTELIQRQLIES